MIKYYKGHRPWTNAYLRSLLCHYKDGFPLEDRNNKVLFRHDKTELLLSCHYCPPNHLTMKQPSKQFWIHRPSRNKRIRLLKRYFQINKRFLYWSWFIHYSKHLFFSKTTNILCVFYNVSLTYVRSFDDYVRQLVRLNSKPYNGSNPNI